MRHSFIWCVAFLVCGAVVLKGQTGTEGEAVLAKSEYANDVRTASFQMLLGNGIVNAGDQSQSVTFVGEGTYVKGMAALTFKSSSFTLNDKASSVEFDGHFRFRVSSTDKDRPAQKKDCNGELYAVDDQCELFFVFVNVVNGITGESVQTITSHKFRAGYGEETDMLEGNRYQVDIASIREKVPGLQGVPFYIEATVLTGSQLLANYESGSVAYRSGFEAMGLK